MVIADYVKLKCFFFIQKNTIEGFEDKNKEFINVLLLVKKSSYNLMSIYASKRGGFIILKSDRICKLSRTALVVLLRRL